VRRALPLVIGAAVSALLTVVCLRHGADLARALRRVPPIAFAVATLLHLVVVGIRTEAWRLTLAALGSRPPLAVAHWASAVGFLAGTVEGHAILPARMAVARKLAPADVPGLRQMLLSDVPVFAIECCLIAALLPLAATRIDGAPGWSVLLAPVGAVGAVLGLRLLHKRLSASPLAGGLKILATPGLRVRLAALAAAIVALTYVRVWILIGAVGMANGPADAAVAYVAVTLAGQLPIGPAAGPAGMVVIAGEGALAKAAAAGLAISATSIGAVILYLVVVGAASIPRRVSALRDRSDVSGGTRSR
jgi:hypothetical protein